MDSYDKSFNSTCRLCLNYHVPSTGMVSLHTNAGEFHKKTLLQFAKISIDFNDKLPTQICPDCVKSIKQVHSFVKMCQYNDENMRRLVHSKGNAKCKVLISQYAIFRRYFPEEIIKNHTPSASIKSEKENMDKQLSSQVHNNESDDFNDYDDVNNIDDSEDMDAVLDSMENIVTSSTQSITRKKHSEWLKNSKAIDSVLDSMERVVSNRIIHRNLKKKVPVTHKPKKDLTCKICDKTLKTQYSLDYHMQIHTVKYKFMCEHCGKGFAAEPPLSRHLIFTHGIGPFKKCDQCSFKCYKPCELVEHIRLHTGERPFTCEKCGLTFRRRAIWKNHLIHHEEKKVDCPVCHRKFYRQSEMAEHYNSTHERMFLFMCSVCNTSFAKRNSVRKHLVSKHNIPREQQGKILRIVKEGNNTNSLVFEQNKCKESS